MEFRVGELEKLVCWALERKVLINGKAGVDSFGPREQYVQRMGGRSMYYLFRKCKEFC